jgi:hypothetical protein
LEGAVIASLLISANLSQPSKNSLRQINALISHQGRLDAPNAVAQMLILRTGPPMLAA